MHDSGPVGAGPEEGRGANGRSARRHPVEDAFGDLAAAARHLRTLASVRTDRARLRVRRTLSRLWARVLEGVALAALAVSGVVLVAIGLDGAFRALFEGRPWLGRLAAGATLLAGLATWLWFRRALRERRELERHRTKYDPIERNDRRGS